ncbi:hypothetical protein AB0M11_15095 [Streptomyces sp. NPDC051987]|uniref:hypothetical protein n=1 Tax=Streptomyces sp. NPDC051987 TaxID=3155808 RepID=UPI00343AD2A3
MDTATLGDVLRKLADFETMTLNDLRTQPGRFTEYELPSGLCKEALARLSALGHDGMTRIQRFRFTGTQRLYGFLDGNVFHVLWWDPKHEVYPSSLKHT